MLFFNLHGLKLALGPVAFRSRVMIPTESRTIFSFFVVLPFHYTSFCVHVSCHNLNRRCLYVMMYVCMSLARAVIPTILRANTDCFTEP
jgi:hypothetical protein